MATLAVKNLPIVSQSCPPRGWSRISHILLWSAKKLWHPLGGSGATVVAGKGPSRARLGFEYAELVSLVLAVCTAVFLTKTVIAYRDLANAKMPPQICDDELLPSLGRVSACCAEDFAVGIGCLLLAAASLALRSSPRYRRVVRVVAHGIAAAAVCYMVVNAQIFHKVGHFLTYSLFQLAGGFQLERSILEGATPESKLAVAGVPLLTLTLHLIGVQAFPGFWRLVNHYLCRPVVLLLLMGGLFGGAHAAQETLFSEHHPDFAHNPHLLLARSFLGNSSAEEEKYAEVAEETDFLTGHPGHTPDLLPQRPRNIILIVLESGGSMHLGTYGSSLPTTPALDGLRDKSLTFENFYATANHTIASALPIFGSTYNDPRTLATVIEYPRFPVPSAADWLHQQGYQTYFLGAGGRRAWEGYRNMDGLFLSHGFDLARDTKHPFWRESPILFADNAYLDAAMFADAKRCLRAAQGQKFFLMMWNYETHYPYFDGPGLDFADTQHFPRTIVGNAEKEEEFRCYLRSLWRVDKLIGDLYHELEQLGLAADTLVVITGDHGEAFGEHGFYYHGWSNYEEEVRVPLVFICPRLAPLGKRSKVVGSHVDMWPTITDVCGLPADPRWQGKSLFAPIPEDQRRAYYYRQTNMIGVREGKYKYIFDYKLQRDLLFDLEKDPGELENLALDHPEFCARQRGRVQDWANFQRQLTDERLVDADR
jgi:arylsulfatase A-like enzyme